MNYEIIPNNFCALPEGLSRYEDARAAVIPIPYEATTSYVSGTKRGPAAIIQASRNMETFDIDLEKDICDVGICTLEEIAPLLGRPDDMMQAVEEAVSKVLDDGKFPLILGGEHSITAGAVRAFSKKGEDFSVIQFDAHLDLRDSYEGAPYSHACVMRRIHELGIDFVQLGIRSACREEYQFARSKRLAFYSPQEIRKSAAKLSGTLRSLKEHVYITFDVDALDASVMSSTGTPEPGGLSWEEAIGVLEMIADLKRIIGCDVVELCPNPASIACDFTAAKLAYKMLGFALCRVK